MLRPVLLYLLAVSLFAQAIADPPKRIPDAIQAEFYRARVLQLQAQAAMDAVFYQAIDFCGSRATPWFDYSDRNKSVCVTKPKPAAKEDAPKKP